MLLTVDSSIIVASLIEKENHHEACKRIVDDILDAKHEAVMPYSVLVETVGAIKRRTGSEELAEKAINDLENMAAIYFIELTKERAREAANIAKESGLRGMDAIIVQVATENNAVLVSLDNDMLKKSRKFARTMNIEEF
jgi:predicted nucleic acid-binding protein